MRAVWQRAAVAAALLWTAALLLYAGAGRVSIVLIAAPVVFAIGDALAHRRKARLTALVDTTLPTLVSSAADGPRFSAVGATTLERRERLLGALPPTLHADRLLRTADGQRFRVRAVVARLDADRIVWRVERLSD